MSMMWKMSLQRCWDIDICDFNLSFFTADIPAYCDKKEKSNLKNPDNSDSKDRRLNMFNACF